MREATDPGFFAESTVGEADGWGGRYTRQVAEEGIVQQRQLYEVLHTEIHTTHKA